MTDHEPAIHRATFRFYAELNDFLETRRRQRDFEYRFTGSPGIVDAVQALGVPHIEVDLILVNGVSVGFDHRLRDGDRVSVYPVFESMDVSGAVRLRPEPLRRTRFVLDVHLGRLARILRLLGFDCAYDRSADDAGIIEQSLSEHRIILTRDTGLLKSRRVTHGYWVRATDPRKQASEVLSRLDLAGQARLFERCSVCNGKITLEDTGTASLEAPARVRSWCREYFRCGGCGRLYWKGTHFQRLEKFLLEVVEAAEGGIDGPGAGG